MDEPHLPLPVAVEQPAARAAITTLVVDDEAHVRCYLRTMLRGLGVATIWEAANGLEAVELFRAQRPALVLLDINMPKMRGQDTMEQILLIDPDAAVVIVSAQNELPTIRQFQELGALAFVLKHSPSAQITLMLEEILDRFVIEA